MVSDNPAVDSTTVIVSSLGWVTVIRGSAVVEFFDSTVEVWSTSVLTMSEVTEGLVDWGGLLVVVVGG